jgi:hypothetical protein
MRSLDTARDLKWRRIATAGVVACVALIACTAAYPFLQARLGAASLSGYRVGQIIDLPEAVYRDRSHTVVVFARSSCAASQAMKPLLAGIVDDFAEDAASGVLLVTPIVNALDEAAFAAEIGVASRQHLAHDLTTLKVARVPTVVVVDRRGRVEYVHSGQPKTADDQAAIRRAVMAVTQER